MAKYPYLAKAPRPYLTSIIFIFVYLAWGSNYVVIKLALTESPPLLLAGIRCLIAGPFLIAIALLLGHRLPHNRNDYTVIFFSALFLLVFASAGVTWSQQWVPANIAATVVASSALWLVFLGGFGKDGEHLTSRQWISVTSGLIGLCMILLPEIHLNPISPIKVLVLITASISLALGSLVMRRHPTQCSPIIMAGLQSCIAALILIPIALCSGERTEWHVSSSLFSALLYLGIIGSGLSYSAFCWLASTVTPFRLASISYINPAIAIFMAQFILKEKLSFQQLVGVAIIIISMALLMNKRGNSDTKITK